MTSSNQVLAAAVRITRATKYGFLTTFGGEVRSRVVQHLEVTEQAEVTFSTDPTSRKATALATDSQAIYCVVDNDTAAAATIYGTARFDRDPQRSQELWIDDLTGFFPAGPTAEGFTLVTIAPTRIEVWSLPDDSAPPPFGFSSYAIERTGEGWSDPSGTHPSTSG